MSRLLDIIANCLNFRNKDFFLLGGHEDCNYQGYFKYLYSKKVNDFYHAYYECPNCNITLIDADIINQGYALDSKSIKERFLASDNPSV